MWHLCSISSSLANIWNIAGCRKKRCRMCVVLGCFDDKFREEEISLKHNTRNEILR